MFICVVFVINEVFIAGLAGGDAKMEGERR